MSSKHIVWNDGYVSPEHFEQSSGQKGCVVRDPKGLYQKALDGKIPEFTGISAPYEEPLNPELVIDTSSSSIPESTLEVLQLLRQKGILPADLQP